MYLSDLVDVQNEIDIILEYQCIFVHHKNFNGNKTTWNAKWFTFVCLCRNVYMCKIANDELIW